MIKTDKVLEDGQPQRHLCCGPPARYLPPAANNSSNKKSVPSAYLPAPAKKSNEIRVFLKSIHSKACRRSCWGARVVPYLSCGTMDDRLPQTIAEAFACKFPEWNAEKFTRRGESCKSVDIEDVDDLKIFTDAGLEKLDVSETVRSALHAVKADLVPPASSPSKHSAVSFDEDVSAPATKKPRLIDSQQCHQS